MSSPSTAFTYARRLRTAYAVRLRKPYARSVITLLIKHRPDRVRPKLSTQIHRRKESSNQIGAALQFPIRSRSNTLLFAIIMIRHSPNARYDFLGGDSYRGTVHRCLGASISLVSLDYQSDRHCAKTWPCCGKSSTWFDYQSDRHCAKTCSVSCGRMPLFDYQSDRHCAKTNPLHAIKWLLFDYQSDRHCAKTRNGLRSSGSRFDYQSDRHCAKTGTSISSLQTSFDYQSDRHCAKTLRSSARLHVSFDYQSDRHCAKTCRARRIVSGRFDYQSDRHCAKTIGVNSPLQRTFKSDWNSSLTLDKIQVNRSFLLVFIPIRVLLVLEKQNPCF